MLQSAAAKLFAQAGLATGLARQGQRQGKSQWTRLFAAEAAPKAAPVPPPPPPPKKSYVGTFIFLGTLGGAAAFTYTLGGSGAGVGKGSALVEAKKDYSAVRKAIAGVLDNNDYDDGSYGPVLVRLAWHAAGTYDKVSGTGGSNGATMRFAPECEHGANAGLKIARDLLEPIKKQFPWISYADLWTLAGVVAVEEMGGPQVPWRAGRSDKADGAACPPNGRLPDASKTQNHIRDIFYRMGFDDREIVALVGAHSLGRCHTDRSGYSGPWTNAPTTFSNLYFQELKNQTWKKKSWKGPLQYEDKSGKLMMLPADLALIQDKGFKKWVDLYAKDEAAFFNDFAAAFGKLLELGVPFAQAAKA